MLILCAIIGGLLCLTCIFFLLVHPLICVVQCACSKELSGGQKALWIFLSLFFGIFGSLPYALFGSGSARIRSLTWNGMMLGVLNLVLAVGTFAATPEFRNVLGVFMRGESTSSMVFDSTEMSASLGEVSAILEEQSSGLPQDEEPRFVSVVDPEPATENTRNVSTLAEIDPTVQSNSANTAFLDDEVEGPLEDGSNAIMFSTVLKFLSNFVGDSFEVGSDPNNSWLSEENEDAMVTQNSDDRKDIARSQDSLVNKPLETIAPMESKTPLDTSIATKRQDDLLPTRDSSETKTTDRVTPPKTESRVAPLSAMPTREKPSKKKPINRYRPEGSDVEEATLPNSMLPQSLKARNRYKNP
jgi:hypothetical protein